MIDERIGAYLVERQLGAGGMGTVDEARVVDPVDGLVAGERVAINVVHRGEVRVRADVVRPDAHGR